MKKFERMEFYEFIRMPGSMKLSCRMIDIRMIEQANKHGPLS